MSFVQNADAFATNTESRSHAGASVDRDFDDGVLLAGTRQQRQSTTANIGYASGSVGGHTSQHTLECDDDVHQSSCGFFFSSSIRTRRSSGRDDNLEEKDA